MKPTSLLFFVAVVLATPLSLRGADPVEMSADELATRMNADGQGSALIRTKLEIQTPGAEKNVLQLQIKQRRTKSDTDLVYQILWPTQRKGEAVFLHQHAGEPPRGSIFIPPGTVRTIKGSAMDEGLFGSDLAYQDAIENFFAWKNQKIVGAEVILEVSCQILESKPGDSDVSTYGKVRSWIDPRRLVPMRVEKYSPAGELVRRIDTTRVAPDERHHPIAASLTVHGPRKDSVTQFSGARIDQDVSFSDADFTPAKVSP